MSMTMPHLLMLVPSCGLIPQRLITKTAYPYFIMSHTRRVPTYCTPYRYPPPLPPAMGKDRSFPLRPVTVTCQIV
ncbi:hypothetical protein F4679DRAFT_548539, partial [Xylaria curta]